LSFQDVSDLDVLHIPPTPWEQCGERSREGGFVGPRTRLVGPGRGVPSQGASLVPRSARCPATGTPRPGPAGRGCAVCASTVSVAQWLLGNHRATARPPRGPGPAGAACRGSRTAGCVGRGARARRRWPVVGGAFRVAAWLCSNRSATLSPRGWAGDWERARSAPAASSAG